jgi:hypothetical protein
MRTRALGTTGIVVSEIGLGTRQLGAFREWGGPGEEESVAIVDEALKLGRTFFDRHRPLPMAVARSTSALRWRAAGTRP